MHTEITTHFEALVRGLALAITAPTQAKADECLEMALGFAAGFSSEEIKKAKAMALIEVEQWEMAKTHGVN